MRGAFFVPPILPKEGESKKAAIILMKNSHFDRTPQYYIVCTAKMFVERDDCLRLQCEVKTNNHLVSFLSYHFNFLYWLDYSKEKGKEIQTLVHSNFSTFSILK